MNSQLPQQLGPHFTGGGTDLERQKVPVKQNGLGEAKSACETKSKLVS